VKKEKRRNPEKLLGGEEGLWWHNGPRVVNGMLK
jgi:hypothetical protein